MLCRMGPGLFAVRAAVGIGRVVEIGTALLVETEEVVLGVVVVLFGASLVACSG